MLETPKWMHVKKKESISSQIESDATSVQNDSSEISMPSDAAD